MRKTNRCYFIERNKYRKIRKSAKRYIKRLMCDNLNNQRKADGLPIVRTKQLLRARKMLNNNFPF